MKPSVLAAALPGLVVALALFACASLPEASYKLYAGPAQPVAELAVVQLGDAHAAAFDGRVVRRSDWGAVQLLPGRHTIRWQREFGVSVMIDPRGFATGGNEETVTLEAGHTYTLKAERTTGRGYRMFFWIRDETAGKVIAGEPKP